MLISVWSLLWRAQAAHGLVYLGLPLAWELLRQVLILLTLPLLIVGFGDSRIGQRDGALDHLKKPGCWIFAAPCAGPRSQWLHAPVVDTAQCVRDVCPPSRPRLPDLGGWGWKTLWLALTLAWLLRWRAQHAARQTRIARD